MSHQSRFLSILLISITSFLILSLTACGGSDESDSRSLYEQCLAEAHEQNPNFIGPADCRNYTVLTQGGN